MISLACYRKPEKFKLKSNYTHQLPTAFVWSTIRANFKSIFQERFFYLLFFHPRRFLCCRNARASLRSFCVCARATRAANSFWTSSLWSAQNHDRQLISNFKAIVSAPVLDFSYGRGKRDHSKNVSWVWKGTNTSSWNPTEEGTLTVLQKQGHEGVKFESRVFSLRRLTSALKASTWGENSP